MSLDSKLQIIKNIKEKNQFKYILNHMPFTKDKKVTVFLKGKLVGEMDVNCISLIYSKLKVKYFLKTDGSFDLMFGSDKRVENIIRNYTYEDEEASVNYGRTHMTLSYSNESFITLDHTNNYKITDCSCPTAIDSFLFKDRYNTFDEDTLQKLKKL